MRRPCAGPARVLRKTMIVRIDRGAWLALGFLDSACILEAVSLPPLLGEWRAGQKAFTLSTTRMLAISSLTPEDLFEREPSSSDSEKFRHDCITP